MKQTLWTREFTRITAATALGAAGGIISQFALSFLVFDETGSTLAAALVVAIQLIPMVLLPLVVAPMMDRLPRKPFLVWGDLLNGVCYAGAGLFLLHSSFSYIAYLAFSLLVSCLGAFDELAYNSFYPLLLPKGQEERAYTVSAMLYPILKVLMMPLFDSNNLTHMEKYISSVSFQLAGGSDWNAIIPFAPANSSEKSLCLAIYSASLS